MNPKLFSAFPERVLWGVVAVCFAISACVIPSINTIQTPSSDTDPRPSTSNGDGMEVTSTPRPTRTPTQTTDSVSEMSEERIRTPLPSLDSATPVQIRDDLLNENLGCKLPCVWGIWPGVTNWEEARVFFRAFVDSLQEGESLEIKEDGSRFEVASHYVLFSDRETQAEFGARLTSVDKWVGLIFINSESAGELTLLENVLNEYGAPDNIYVNSRSSPAPFGLPFKVIVSYDNDGFILLYETEAEISDELVVGCIHDDLPALWAWSDRWPWLRERVMGVAMDGSPEEFLKLQDVSDFTIDSFANTYTSPDPQPCIGTFRSAWE